MQRARPRTCVSESTRTAASAVSDSTGAWASLPDYKDIDGPVARLNRLSREEGYAERRKGGCATRWGRETAALKPFWDVTQVVIIGHRVWTELSEDDWLEAFRAHPKIGETKTKAAVTEQERQGGQGR